MRPTILQVIPALESGGVEIETIEIANAIIAAGGKALIASRPGKLANNPLTRGIELKNLPLDTKNPFQIYKNTKLLKDLILKEKVDIVHVRSRAPAWSVYKAARDLNVPFVTTYHAAYSSKTIFKSSYNSIMAKGDRVIAISQFILDHLTEKYSKKAWFDPSKIRLIHRGVDFHYFDPSSISPQDVQQLREKWGISPDTRVLLLPGRISRTKGQDLLIKALSLMKHVDVTTVFVGSAQGHESYRDSLLHLASSLGLKDRVKWMPPCSDIAVAYQVADMIVCPSLVPEGFGRLMTEAQAMKKPIIASDHGAAREVIADRGTGWLTPPGDARALAHAIDYAFNLPQKSIDEMGTKGRARVEAYFSKEAMSSKTIALYQELLDEKHAMAFCGNR
jgi:glycosyltransferase involved in cell wall biosynthesis